MHQGMEHVITSVSTKTAYASSGGLILFGYFDAQEFGIFCGLGIGLLTFFVNLFFKMKDDRRRIRADRRQADWLQSHTPAERPPHEKDTT